MNRDIQIQVSSNMVYIRQSGEWASVQRPSRKQWIRSWFMQCCSITRCAVFTHSFVVTQVADFPLNIPELGPCQTPLDHQRHPVGLLEFPALHGPLDRLESVPAVRHATRPQDAGVLPRLMFTFLF